MSIGGIAQSYALAGQKTEARTASKKLLRNWRDADEDLPQVKTAKEWLMGN
jgi:hypothetical protein